MARKIKEAYMLPEFELLLPQTLSEALAMLAEKGPEITPLAGGTNVIVELRQNRPRHRVLMDVSRLAELRGMRREDGHVVLGGGTTIAELLTDPLIAAYGAPLRQAAAVLGSPLVRNRATVAGNLVDASPAADTAPPLLALGAEVELASRAATRRVPLDAFFVGPNETVRRPDELLVAIHWPVPPPHSAAAFHKLGLRQALACAVVNAAVMVERDVGAGASPASTPALCRQARIALGAVAPKPIRPHTAEDLLRGQRLTPNVIAEAARLAAKATHPIDDVRGSAAYRRRVTEVLVRRLLDQVARSKE
jgi:CO/xanthine dehydrogenase FAD-binding subunit